jgi:hypothetical protein
MIELIKWQLAIFAGAVLAIEIAYGSSLAQDIKQLVGLTEPGETKRKWKWWFKPIAWLIYEIRTLFQCPYCLSFWTCSAINLGIFGMDLLHSTLFGLLGLVYVHVWERMTK